MRALPFVATNLLSLVCAVQFGWPVLGLFIFVILETWLLIALDCARIAIAPGGGLLDGFKTFAAASLFVVVYWVAATLVLDSQGYALPAATRYIVADLLGDIHFMGLAWPLVGVALVHLATFALEIAGKTRPSLDSGASAGRLLALVGPLILAFGPAMWASGLPIWALVALFLVKASLDIWINDMRVEHRAWVDRIEKERADYQASLDPRGMGSWPKPPANPPGSS